MWSDVRQKGIAGVGYDGRTRTPFWRQQLPTSTGGIRVGLVSQAGRWFGTGVGSLLAARSRDGSSCTKAALERIAGQHRGGPPDEPSPGIDTAASTMDLDSPPRDTSVPQETDATIAISDPSSAGGHSTSKEDVTPGATRPASSQDASGETVEFDSDSPASSATPNNEQGATLGPDPVAGKPQLKVQVCELLDELGRGGMGVVFKARETATQRLVCIKMMLAGEYASPDAVRRFQIETEAAASLDHPNIVPIYRAGETRGIP